MNSTEVIHPPDTRKLKRWPAALLVAAITAAIGGALALPAGLWAMEMLDVSKFEGSRYFGVAFIWLPLGIMVGFAGGFVISFFVARTGFAGFAIRQGLATLFIATLLAGADGIAYLKSDHPPRIHWKKLEVEMQLRVPAKGRSVEELESRMENPFAIRFMSGGDFASHDRVDWDKAQRTDEFITVPIWGELYSQTSDRVLTAQAHGEVDEVFPLPVPAAPKQIDKDWSPWMGPHAQDGVALPAPEDRYSLRYRVRFAEKYSQETQE